MMPDNSPAIPDVPPGFRFARRGGLLFLESPMLAELGYVTHAFLTRKGGTSSGRFASLNFSVSVGDREESVAANREILSASLGITSSVFVTLNQVHGDTIAVIGGDGGGTVTRLSCDGLLTGRRGHALAIKTADCVPVFLVDTRRRVIGAVHAGWKGTSLGIAEKAVRLMGRRFGTSPADITAVLGPAIGRCCYEVDEPVRDAMGNMPGRPDVCTPSIHRGHWMCDLPSANRRRLAAAGVPDERIYNAALCTACHPEFFFSHRGEGEPTGRQISFIMLR